MGFGRVGGWEGGMSIFDTVLLINADEDDDEKSGGKPLRMVV